jgi:acyl-coenzyme A thioesterase PaaI-like protein
MSDPGTPVSDPGAPGIVADLGLDHWIEDGVSHGRAAVVPALYVPHTEFVRIGARVLSPGLVELAPHAEVANDRHGTILGGVVAMLAELAAESLFAEVGPVVVTDLDVRFLNRVKVGPLWARARRIGVDGDGHYLVVEMEDVGDEGKPIAYATAQVRSLP